MESLFGFHETLELVNNDVLEFAQNENDAQRTVHKDAEKKDSKAAFCIQYAVDTVNFDWISHAESEKEAWDILVKYYEGGEKVKVVKLQTLQRKYELLQMGEDEKISGYVLKEKARKVYKFHKALYGFKQTPRAWNKKIDRYLVELGFLKCRSKYGVYVYVMSQDIIIIFLYVDDLLVPT
ncbi:uncharacterized protein LOC127122277 [Lathyrus oleraceus]|uniref:uncharacterized protein LOC127122277 n=1 Tax=Pisum sativum TaxID=3888 RepID=UPI0021D3BAD5|nr:uncharacterized protein LOC127122277 [Pisum sativum]